MNKFEEEIEKRYGSFELSHDKNKLITDDIKSFTADVATKFAEFVKDYDYGNGEDMYFNELNWKELFDYFINNHYGK